MMAADQTTESSDYDALGRTVAWRSFLDEAHQRLAAAGSESPGVEARRIVEEASGFEGTEFHVGLKELATQRGVVAFDDMLGRRLGGEPLQYVLGRWGFRTLDLLVDSRVLIPRPETEVVVGVALEELDRLAQSENQLTAVDLGTGTGAIGLSLAVERTDTTVVLTDASAEALQVARANLAGIGRAAMRVSVLEGSWFAPLPEHLRGSVDLVVSNPPYVSPDDELPAEVQDWEPLGALIAADSGRSDLAEVIDGAGAWLRPGGALVIELAPHQAAWAHDRATVAGFTRVDVVADLAGRERVMRGRWPG